ncbi:MAG: hypothetical protein JNK01_05670 [Devosia sp.]|jgi:hypothetical protein|nr:hypothetical protein [Devosia sp.]
MWGKLNDWITWVALGRIRDSFLGKAITAISLAALVLGNVGKALADAGLDPLSAQLTFGGSAIFLVGYLSFSVFVPSEFRKGGDIDEIVGRLQSLSDFMFFKSRRDMAAALFSDIRISSIFGLPDGARLFLRSKLEETAAATVRDWEAKAAGLYHADLNLRAYIRPLARIWVAITFGAGIVLLAAPTLFNVVKTMFPGVG